MLTFAFLTALAITYARADLRAVRIWANQSFTLDGSILRRKQYFKEFSSCSLVVFKYFKLFLKYQILHVKCHKYYYSLW